MGSVKDHPHLSWIEVRTDTILFKILDYPTVLCASIVACAQIHLGICSKLAFTRRLSQSLGSWLPFGMLHRRGSCCSSFSWTVAPSRSQKSIIPRQQHSSRNSWVRISQTTSTWTLTLLFIGCENNLGKQIFKRLENESAL